MAKRRVVFECTTCGAQAPKWAGRCDGCGHWNTLIESVIGGSSSTPGAPVGAKGSARPAQEVAELSVDPVPTGLGELDHVLGGGLVPGAVTVLGGEPGVGKSTVLAQVAAMRAATGATVLYLSAEESARQVSARLERLGYGPENLWLGNDGDLGSLLADIRSLEPELVIVDSIQTVFDPEVGSAPGSVAQVRHCAHEISRVAKDRDVAVVLVGQVTKDGALAGPRVLEHLVDTVLSFEGDRELGLRVLRAVKHRYGPTGELGVLEMTGRGLVEVGDPSSLLLADRRPEVAGSAIGVAVEGRRALLVEIQALVTEPAAPTPRRSAQGLDQGRLSMLLAVLQRRADVRAVGLDVYASIIGGVRVTEPGIDLGLCAAIASSVYDQPVGADVVVLGEVGLAGEVRGVPWIDRRLAEAARLGFTSAVVPAGTVTVDPPLEVIPVPTLAGALTALGVDGTGRPAMRMVQAPSRVV